MTRPQVVVGAAILRDGRLLEFERIYPLDAAFDTLDDVPEDIRTNKRYRDVGDYTIAGLVSQWRRDFGDQSLDIVVHSLANGPEVRNPLIETSRSGYLAALSVSAYSMVAMVRHLAPLMSSDGAFMALSYLAGQRVIPGYGGGMSSAKAALESDVRVLAHEAGRRYGLRVNCISAGPLASRAASAIGEIDRMVDYVARNTPLAVSLQSDEVGQAAASAPGVAFRRRADGGYTLAPGFGPDLYVGPDAFRAAIEAYRHRERRFGLTGEQLQENLP